MSGGPAGYGQQQIMEDSSNEILANASPMSQQIEWTHMKLKKFEVWNTIMKI